MVGNWIDNIHVFLPLTALADERAVVAVGRVLARGLVGGERVEQRELHVVLVADHAHGVGERACRWAVGVDRQRRVGEKLLALAQALAVPVDDRAPVEHDGPLEQARHGAAAGVDPAPVLEGHGSRLPWYSRSVDSTYLTAKRVFVFGDATHAIGIARVAAKELGFTVVGLGTYGREFAREVRAGVRAAFGVTLHPEPLWVGCSIDD